MVYRRTLNTMNREISEEDFDRMCQLVEDDNCPEWKALEEIAILLKKYKTEDKSAKLYALLFSRPMQFRNMVSISRSSTGGYVLNVGNGRDDRQIAAKTVQRTWSHAVREFLYTDVITKDAMAKALNMKGDSAGTSMKLLWEAGLMESAGVGKYRVSEWVRSLSK
jgi:hypothetical protein